MFDLLEQSQPKVLRPHQVKAIDMVRSSARNRNTRIVVQMPTGAGKTITAAKLIEASLAKNKKVIFTAPAVSLIDQTVSAFEAEGIRDIGVMQANHPRTNSLARVQVASVQTLARREIPDAALVLVDECHVRSKVIEALMAERPDVFFIGLSATPWAKGMGLVWQDLVIPCTIGDLIGEGYLSEFRVFAPDVPDMSGVKTVAGDYHEGQAAEVMEGKALMASVVETWLARGDNRPTLLFGANCAHARALFEEFQRAGVAAAYVDAYTDSVERQVIERRFRAGEVKVACSVRTLTTGVDWPVSCIIDAAPTRSEMLHCLDADTEILTSNGWRGIGEVNPGDCVASCVGLDQEAGQWAMVKGVVRRDMAPNEKWVEYDSVHANFRVTGDHRMIFATGHRAFKYGSALDLASKSDGVKVPSAVSIEQPGVPLSADELWLIGMLMADGTFNERSQQVSIYQSERHPEIVRRIEETLTRLGVSHRKSPLPKPKRGGIVERYRRWRWNISVGSPRTKVGVGRFAPHPDSVKFDGYRGLRWLMPWLDKDLAIGLMAMSKPQFEFFMQGFWDGDGSKKKGVDYTPHTKQVLTVREVLADRLQALGAINGYMVNKRHYDPEGRKRQYFLSFKDQDWRHIGGTGRKPCLFVSDATPEEVWCVETTTGNIVTRRRGKVTVMGNCQKIGRGLRVNPGTEDLLVLDHAGNSLRLGLVTDIHHNTLSTTAKGEREAREPAEKLPKECANCGALHTGLTCPFCGHERKPVAGVETVDGELIELTPQKAKATKDEKQRFYSMALWMADGRGYKKGWAANLYKKKMGCWPRGLSDARVPADQSFLNYEKSRRIAYAKARASK